MKWPTRNEKRVSAVLPVRISGLDEDGRAISCVAHTLNVSASGAVIAGVTLRLRAGMMVRIVRGRANSAFKVAWVGSRETNSADQIGVQVQERVNNFWGLDQLKSVSADEEFFGSQRRKAGVPPAGSS
jgi:hypothetical protein